MNALYANTSHNSVLIISCIHGDEPQGKFLTEEYIKENPDTRLIFIPCLNEYGFINGVRTNANGVDINRNFPAKNWKLTKKDKFFGGNAPASEFETKFVMETIEKYKPKLVLTLHAPYKIVNYDGDAEEISEKISAIIGYPVEKSIGYPTPGSFGSWCGIEKNIPVVTLELDEEVDVKLLKKPMFKIFELLENY